MSPFNELLTELKSLDTIRQFHGSVDRWRENLQVLADAKAQAMRFGKSLSVRFERPAFASAAAGSRIEPVEGLLSDYAKVRANAENVGSFINHVRHQVVAKALRKAEAVVPVRSMKPAKRKTTKPSVQSPAVAGSFAPAAYAKPAKLKKPAATAADVIAEATKARAQLVAEISLGKMTAAEINARDLKLRNIIARANKAQSASA